VMIEMMYIAAVVVFVLTAVVSVLIWLFYGYGMDKLKNPEEWSDKGRAGERAFWMALTKEIGVPEEQILRNVYIPIGGDKTSEIDLLVVSKKGIFVMECKNYGGNIYGDARRKRWIQYVGNKKSYFYNPLMQNRVHCENLRKYLGEAGNVPIVSMVGTIKRGNWKVRGFRRGDYLLGYNCHFKDVYGAMGDSESMGKYWNVIMGKLRPLERPGGEVVEKHIGSIRYK